MHPTTNTVVGGYGTLQYRYERYSKEVGANVCEKKISFGFGVCTSTIERCTAKTSDRRKIPFG